MCAINGNTGKMIYIAFVKRYRVYLNVENGEIREKHAQSVGNIEQKSHEKKNRVVDFKFGEMNAIWQFNEKKKGRKKKNYKRHFVITQ